VHDGQGAGGHGWSRARIADRLQGSIVPSQHHIGAIVGIGGLGLRKYDVATDQDGCSCCQQLQQFLAGHLARGHRFLLLMGLSRINL